MCNRLGLAFGVRVRLRVRIGLGFMVRVRVRVRVGLGVNKVDINYNIVTSPLYSTLAIAALGYSGPEST